MEVDVSKSVPWKIGGTPTSVSVAVSTPSPELGIITTLRYGTTKAASISLREIWWLVRSFSEPFGRQPAYGRILRGEYRCTDFSPSTADERAILLAKIWWRYDWTVQFNDRGCYLTGEAAGLVCAM